MISWIYHASDNSDNSRYLENFEGNVQVWRPCCKLCSLVSYMADFVVQCKGVVFSYYNKKISINFDGGANKSKGWQGGKSPLPPLATLLKLVVYTKWWLSHMISWDFDSGATEADGRASDSVGPSVSTPLMVQL